MAPRRMAGEPDARVLPKRGPPRLGPERDGPSTRAPDRRRPFGPEAADILEAIDLGRGGSLLAIQSTGIEAALLRLADLAWAPGQDRGHAVHLVAARIHLAVYLDRDRSGDRRVKRAARVTEDGGGWKTLPLWQESSFDNGLGAAELERLAFLAEECAEAIQVVAKIVRHGWESRDPTRAGGPTNRQMLETGRGDIRFATARLTDTGDLSAESIWAAPLRRVLYPKLIR